MPWFGDGHVECCQGIGDGYGDGCEGLGDGHGHADVGEQVQLVLNWALTLAGCLHFLPW